MRLPTFAELAEPARVARGAARGARQGRPRRRPSRSISIASTGSTTSTRTGQVATPVHVELPEALTGVKARIVVALGALFPMIRAHKVLAAYACLAPRLVAGPLRSDAAARGVALDRQLLPRRRRHLAHPRLPRRRRAAGGHEPGAVRLAGRVGGGARGHRAHAGHRVQRQGDLRQVRRAGARSRQRDRQPVQRVRQLPRRTGAAPARRWSSVFEALRETVARPAARRLRLGQRLGRHARRRRLPQGQARHQDRRGRGGRVPDAAR